MIAGRLENAQRDQLSLKYALDSVDRELAAAQDYIAGLVFELQIIQCDRDEAVQAEARSRELANEALVDLAQKTGLVAIIKDELKEETGERAEQQVLREYFEAETMRLRSRIGKLDAELSRARTKEARNSIIEAFLSHLAGGLVEG